MRISSDILPHAHAILQPLPRHSDLASHLGTAAAHHHEDAKKHQPLPTAHYRTHPDPQQRAGPTPRGHADPAIPAPPRAAPPPPACPPAAPRARDPAPPALESWPGASRGAAARAAAARAAAACAAAARAAVAAAVEDLSLGPGEPTRPGALDAPPPPHPAAPARA
jgi:hypothetical protein